MRALAVGLVCLTLGCGGTVTETNTVPRIWAEPHHALLPGARPFALGADAPDVYPTRHGSWGQPLQLEGVVVRTGALEQGPLVVPVPEWLGTHEMVLRHGRERVVLQYDSPAGPAPVRRGERVRVFAHTMLVGDRLAFGMVVRNQNGGLAMAGFRASRPCPELLPDGWSVGFGPPTRSVPLCGGRLAERAVRVRGPGGEAVVTPGWTSVARIGPGGEPYAIDVAKARHADGTCARAAQETELSVVIRRAGARWSGG